VSWKITIAEHVVRALCAALIVSVALLSLSGGEVAPLSFVKYWGTVCAGLAAGFIAAHRRERTHTVGRPLWHIGYALFLLLEHSVPFYCGVLAGLITATILWTVETGASWSILGLVCAAGATIGIVLGLLAQVGHRVLRSSFIGLALAGLIAAGTWLVHSHYPDAAPANRLLAGTHLLVGTPLILLLAFAGVAPESEAEISLVLALVGIALGLLLPGTLQALGLIVPLGLYLMYTSRLMTPIQAFKYVMRGSTWQTQGRFRDAILAYRRALELRPGDRLARTGLWRLHRDLDLQWLASHPEIRTVLDAELCLQRAQELLLSPGPSPETLQEADKLLSLALELRPQLQPVVCYWRAVAYLHAGHYDAATEELLHILTGEYPPADPYRRHIIARAWRLALLDHPELARRLGPDWLAREHLMFRALRDVQEVYSGDPADTATEELREYLYGHLTESMLAEADAASQAYACVDFDYCARKGQELLAQAPARGAELLRIAARGQPTRAPWYYWLISQADVPPGREFYWEQALRAGQRTGLDRLEGPAQEAYFQAARLLAESAYARGDVSTAIWGLTVFSASPHAGVDTWRLLAELHERQGNIVAALVANERALIFDPGNALFRERKDRYYYSLTPEALVQAMHTTNLREVFDVAYCWQKAASLLQVKNAGPEQLDWAEHLATLAIVADPENITALVAAAQVQLRKSNFAQAQELLERVWQNRPQSFQDAQQEQAWYYTVRTLGDLYLQQGRLDLAVACLNEYRKSPRSGADTLYKLGQAYEQLGDRARAARCYQHVTVYDHPLAWEAEAALRRLEGADLGAERGPE